MVKCRETKTVPVFPRHTLVSGISLHSIIVRLSTLLKAPKSIISLSCTFYYIYFSLIGNTEINYFDKWTKCKRTQVLLTFQTCYVWNNPKSIQNVSTINRGKEKEIHNICKNFHNRVLPPCPFSIIDFWKS